MVTFVLNANTNIREYDYMSHKNVKSQKYNYLMLKSFDNFLLLIFIDKVVQKQNGTL